MNHVDRTIDPRKISVPAAATAMAATGAALALLAALLVQWHAVRRLGGITGDVLGALVQVAVTVTYVVLSLG